MNRTGPGELDKDRVRIRPAAGFFPGAPLSRPCRAPRSRTARRGEGCCASASGARRGGYAKGRERRAAILHAANDVFAARGFHKAALSTIAKQVGLSEAGLLHHFPSKEHLLLELLAMRHEHDGERVARALDHHEGFLDALLGLCRENQDTPGLVRLFAILAAESVDDDHPAHDWMLGRYRTLRERFVPRIEAEQREGRIDPGLDPHRLAPQLIAMWDGLQVQWLLDPEGVDMSALFEDFLDRLRPPV